MDKKEELLKLLGFSDKLIEKINDSPFENTEFISVPLSNSVIEPFTIIPTDLQDVIINKTKEPQNIIYNSIYR